jgi:divinyl protochlorophyllide a 8-vinyl-reductase
MIASTPFAPSRAPGHAHARALAPAESAQAVPRIGPNAITRIGEALRARVGEPGTVRVFVAAGLDAYLPAMPVAMVDEAEVTRLHHALRAAYDADGAAAIARDAGRLTGDYLLAYRIPRPVKALLRLLPAALAAGVLVRAIERNGWTFCGSARLTVRVGATVRFRLVNCAICRDAQADHMLCDYYAATFERLFEALVAGNTVVTEIECEATGGEACVFEARW